MIPYQSSHLNQAKMYHIDSGPSEICNLNRYPCKHSNNDNIKHPEDHQQQSLSPNIYKIEHSPSPSLDNSTLTNSFHSVGGYQTNHEQSSYNLIPANNKFFVSGEDHLYRHSSSSIDHKSLNLARFRSNSSIKPEILCSRKSDYLDHRVRFEIPTEEIVDFSHQPPIEPFKGANYQANVVSLLTKRSNSFQSNQQGANLSIAQYKAFPAKRSSVNFALGSGHNYRCFANLQRHLSTIPVPQPPRAPNHQTIVSNQVSFTEPALLSENQNMDREGKQALGAGSLDNINQIVDEENTSCMSQANECRANDFTEDLGRYMFACHDDRTYKMDTMKPVQRTSSANKDKIEQKHTIVEFKTVDQHNQINGKHSTNTTNTNTTNQSSLATGNFFSGLEDAVRFDDLNVERELEMSNRSEVMESRDRHKSSYTTALGQSNANRGVPLVEEELGKYIAHSYCF